MRRLTLRHIIWAIGLSVLCILLVFSINNSNESKSTEESQAIKCDCQEKKSGTIVTVQSIKSITNASAKLTTLATTTTTTSTLSTKAPRTFTCKQLDSSSAVQRAIIIYYPHHQSEYFFPEVRWLYRSWVEMLHFQPKTWRTDFIIFTFNFTDELRRLGCVNRLRQTKEESSICRVFIYVPIRLRFGNISNNNFEHAFDDAKRVISTYKDLNDTFVSVPIPTDSQTFDQQRSESLYTHLKSYGYIDSINVMYEGYWTFKTYDFVLRTDIDVFIYRHFGSYIPQNCSFLTGAGGYGTHFNRRKLGRIAHDMGLQHANVSGMGSTWYGSPYDSYLVANMTLNGMLWLAQYEFSTPERESKVGVLLWPEWHYGVLLLYGQHLALNHLVAVEEIRMIIGNNLLDQSSTDNTTQYVKSGVRLNLHCWHTDERFSKFAFKVGKYNQTDLELYRNDTTAQAYAMRMALESKYMTLEEMAAYGRNL